uniref:Uncharacterized protein n=1 Tax=Oryza sativa subsp. japonica TaxID=39947 RepID=Q84QL1_ORYSJ|nr:hypothetical protein [Oryza sativa Japonica Group]
MQSPCVVIVRCASKRYPPCALAGAGAGGGGFSGSACGWEESKYTTNGEYEGWADGDVACRACFGADGFAVNPALLQLVLQIASKVTTKK